MDLPAFKGQTYVEWLEKRHDAYKDLANEYQSAHPQKEVKNGICFATEFTMQFAGAIPNSGLYALAGIYPQLQRLVDPRDRRDGLAPQEVSWLTFLPAWWETYEKFIWGMAEHAPQGPVPYCRISPQ
jgi:hypothetical protein